MWTPSLRQQFPPLRYPDFRKLFVSNVITNAGFWFTTVALYSIFVFRTDVGPLAIGGLTVVGAVPRTLGSPVLGVFADRYSRRNIIVASELASAALILVLIFYQSLVLAYVMYFLLGLFTAVADPAHEAIIPQIMDDDEVGQANGLVSSSESAAQILGPAAAGALLTVVSPEVLFLVDVVSYVLSAGVMATVAAFTVPTDSDTLFGEVRTGVGTFVDSQLLLLVGAAGVVLFAALAPFEALIMLYIRDVIASGGTVYGTAVSMTAGGALVAGVLIGKYGDVIDEPVTVAVALVFDGAAMVGHVVLPSVPTLFAMSFVMGLTTSTTAILLVTMIQTHCDDSVTGRVLGIFNGLTEGSQLTFMLLASVVTGYFGILNVFAGAGASLVVFGVAFGSTRFVDMPPIATAEG